MIAALGILFGFSLFLAPAVTYAQSAEDHCVETNADTNEDEEPATVLGLIDDTGVIQLPDNSQSLLYIAILGNDTAPNGDPLDWDTVDLDPETAGLQTSIDLPHPDDSDFSCGTIRVSTFGILQIRLQDPCEDSIFSTLAFSTDLIIAPFTYTAQTVSAVTAPAPATVTVTTQTEAVESVVTAVIDEYCSGIGSPPWIVPLLDNDTTSTGTLDPSSTDLNPSLPGRQTSATVDSVDSDDVYTITLDNSGNLTVSLDAEEPTGSIPIFYYTVENSLGTVSNVGGVMAISCIIG